MDRKVPCPRSPGPWPRSAYASCSQFCQAEDHRDHGRIHRSHGLRPAFSLLFPLPESHRAHGQMDRGHGLLKKTAICRGFTLISPHFSFTFFLTLTLENPPKTLKPQIPSKI